ncbi:SPOR domain-containing protein [Vibrio sp. NH-UV-68]|uniref:SPOR domain-containing protein n=1 Tax=unclassified Vibrio TaxID=2614977 RepID=UPI0036F3FD43
MALKPKQSHWKQWTLLAALTLPAWSMPTLADEFLCDATQAATDQLPVLDGACPVGKGLWGKAKPTGSLSTFWIQCGVFSKPLPLTKAKQLYKHISTDVWAKPEDKAYRCLIGPYTDFSIAQQELAKVKTQPEYKQAFIREVVKGAPRQSVRPANKPIAKPKLEKQATTVLAVPAEKAPVIATQPKMASKPKMNKPMDEVMIRLSANVANLEYKVPYSIADGEQFYMEHDLAWNRLDYQGAYKTCYRLGMRLATQDEWQDLMDSKVMQQAKWPMHLPYWGAEKTGLFTSGKVTQLKGTSLLNVMCVKSFEQQ